MKTLVNFIWGLALIGFQATRPRITVMYISVFSWRRQTRLRQVGASGGLRGDVYYFAPCGKKLRTYPEVTRVSKKLFLFQMFLFHNSFMD